MSTRVLRILAVLLIVAGATAAQAQSSPVRAQTPTPEKDDSCIACHEALYLNHDTGKWYCLCEVKARCTFCHGGVLGETTEEAAHQGMTANPLQVDSETCQSCHPSDVQRRVTLFAARAGLSSTPCPTVEALAAFLAPTPAPVVPSGLGTPQIGALWLLGAGFLALIVFAYRCWKADCLQRAARP
jgi:hypothetical protein